MQTAPPQGSLGWGSLEGQRQREGHSVCSAASKHQAFKATLLRSSTVRSEGRQGLGLPALCEAAARTLCYAKAEVDTALLPQPREMRTQRESLHSGLRAGSVEQKMPGGLSWLQGDWLLSEGPQGLHANETASE